MNNFVDNFNIWEKWWRSPIRGAFGDGKVYIVTGAQGYKYLQKLLKEVE